MFGHELQENGSNVACPIASEYDLGLRPFHSNPQFKKTSTKANQNCLTNISMFSQFKAPKDGENTSMGSKNIKDGILTCWSE